jgi:F-type H+-transporting ATPase subunit delta
LLYDEMRGSQVATITTAVPLTSDLKTKVLAKVKELTGKDAEVESIIDENILGGFILRVGDIQYNASISNKLNKLKREFTLN